MNAYIYKAGLLCENCTKTVRFVRFEVRPPDNQDSGQYPQGPYPDGGGEADTPQHCDNCNRFLQNPLTSDGVEYVREWVRRSAPGSVAYMWAEFYGLQPAQEKAHAAAAADCCSVLHPCDSIEVRWPRWRA